MIKEDFFINVLRRSRDTSRYRVIREAFLKHADEYEVNTPLRVAHFWAQALHETGGLKWLKELGGPTYFQRYEMRKDLGNVHRGDGVKYHGRGIFQLTGRANYAKFGKKLGLNLIDHPDMAADPDVAVRIALEYWNSRKLNKWADQDDIKRVTKKINGGYNGLPDRAFWLHRIKDEIGVEY